MNTEKFYMTTREFADLIVQTLEESNYFKSDQKLHPMDIEAAFSTVSFAIASGIDAVIKKHIKTNSYNFDLSSHNINNYSEWKKQNNDKDVKSNAFD